MYNGIKEIVLDNDKLAAFYEGRYDVDLLQNQYLLIKDEQGNYVDKFKWNYGKK